MNGFSESDYVNYRYLIHSNLVDSMVQLVRAAEEFEYKPEGSAMVSRATQLDSIFQGDYEFFKVYSRQVRINEVEVTYQLSRCLRSLWKSDFVQKAFARRDEFELLDSAE